MDYATASPASPTQWLLVGGDVYNNTGLDLEETDIASESWDHLMPAGAGGGRGEGRRGGAGGADDHCGHEGPTGGWTVLRNSSPTC